jgi:2-dehydropantoate 2-reductase
LTLRSPLGDFSAGVRRVASAQLTAEYDVALVACKAFDLEAVIESVRPALRPAGVVLPLLNGLAPYATLDAAWGTPRVLGGVAYISVSLTASGEVVHTGTTVRLIVGARSPEAAPVVHDLLACFKSPPGLRERSDGIEPELWNKWVMICAAR